MTSIADFRLTDAEAATQWRRVLAREWPPRGRRQENFRAVEVITSLALLTVVDPATQGGSDWSRYHPDLQRLSTLCKRSPGSFAEKERNLLGIRPNAGRGERDLFLAVVRDPFLVFELWEPVVRGARLVGIPPHDLPDFLQVDAATQLLGQEALDGDWTQHLDDEVGVYREAGLDPETSERAAMTMARIGQHRFARAVRNAYRDRCGFCGFNAGGFGGGRLLVASHIKPWRDSRGRERLDPRNGIAACPTHDAAFDAGLLTVTDDGRIHMARLLRTETEKDCATAAALSASLRPSLLPSEPEYAPAPVYLRWHHDSIWRNGTGALAVPTGMAAEHSDDYRR